MEWLNFRHLYSFWAVCRYGGFSKAAERLYVSQSTVSEQVSQLEDYLGEELLERNTRSVKMTLRGEALLAYADQIFEKSSQINRVFRDSEDESRRHLKIGIVGGISRNFVYARIEDAFLNQADLHVEVYSGAIDELTRQLRTFDIDMVLSLELPRHQEMSTMTHHLVATSPLKLVGTPELIEQVESGSVAPRLFVFRHPFEGYPVQACSERYGVEFDLAVSTDDISLLRFLANGSSGLALVPEIGVREDLKAGRVKTLDVPNDPSVDIYAISLQASSRRSFVQRLSLAFIHNSWQNA